MSHTLLAQPEVRPHGPAKPTFTSPTHDFYQFVFESADILSSFWQPVLKSVGRMHLEVAGLGMKQGQAAIKLTHDLARSITPMDAYAAQVRYWDAISSQVTQSQQRIAASTTNIPGITISSDVVPLNLKRGHDVMQLPVEDAGPLTRKVA